ncbi:unnamed protein product, partial [Cylicocyclus nassatus]
ASAAVVAVSAFSCSLLQFAVVCCGLLRSVRPAAICCRLLLSVRQSETTRRWKINPRGPICKGNPITKQ